nr:PREDICTED: uncharacterized protein C16orf52 homolog [Bos mutus]
MGNYLGKKELDSTPGLTDTAEATIIQGDKSLSPAPSAVPRPPPAGRKAAPAQSRAARRAAEKKPGGARPEAGGRKDWGCEPGLDREDRTGSSGAQSEREPAAPAPRLRFRVRGGREEQFRGGWRFRLCGPRCLFLAADIFAIASIANPDWINTGESAGALTVGLVRQCQTIHGRDRTCIPPRLPPEWVTTLFFIIMGIISLTVTCGLLVASHWRREATKYARWIAFTGMILFCMAALIFPIGFYINEVGGQPYKLPNNTVVGSSYVLFVLSIFFTIVGLLFAGKVCLPG